VFPPRVVPVNSVKAMRGCLPLEPNGKLVPFTRAVFEAYWGEDCAGRQELRIAERDSAAPVLTIEEARPVLIGPCRRPLSRFGR
jgi:hypothetical protein